MNRNRLADKGHFIDRSKPLDFSFDGKRYMAFEGDTITSALMANDVKIISRSFKYHRPRATVSMAGHDANPLVQIGDDPNVVADTRMVEAGMVVDPVTITPDKTLADALGLMEQHQISGVPVVEGIGAPIRMAAMLVGLGLSQSRVRWPKSKLPD